MKVHCEMYMDLTTLSDWVIKSERKFNVNKCKVMYIRKTNRKYIHTVIGSKIVTTSWKTCE